MRALLPVLIVACGASLAHAQVDLSGHWEGDIPVPKGPSRLALDLARNAKGVWIASLGVPERNASGLVVTELGVHGNNVKFTTPDMPNKPVFDLTLRDSKLNGTVTLRGAALPIEMQRTGEARVELVTPSPAVSAELVGDWDGALSLPDDQTRPLQFHFRNLPDHTVAATLDSPSQGATALSLTGVVQTGRELEFSVRIHGGHFKGTLNAEGNELTGEWVQSPDTPALPCKMKKK